MMIVDVILLILSQQPLYILLWVFGDDKFTKGHFLPFVIVFTAYAYSSVAYSYFLGTVVFKRSTQAARLLWLAHILVPLGVIVTHLLVGQLSDSVAHAIRPYFLCVTPGSCVLNTMVRRPARSIDRLTVNN